MEIRFPLPTPENGWVVKRVSMWDVIMKTSLSVRPTCESKPLYVCTIFETSSGLVMYTPAMQKKNPYPPDRDHCSMNLSRVNTGNFIWSTQYLTCATCQSMPWKQLILINFYLSLSGVLQL